MFSEKKVRKSIRFTPNAVHENTIHKHKATLIFKDTYMSKHIEGGLEEYILHSLELVPPGPQKWKVNK